MDSPATTSIKIIPTPHGLGTTNNIKTKDSAYDLRQILVHELSIMNDTQATAFMKDPTNYKSMQHIIRGDKNRSKLFPNYGTGNAADIKSLIKAENPKERHMKILLGDRAYFRKILLKFNPSTSLFLNDPQWADWGYVKEADTLIDASHRRKN